MPFPGYSHTYLNSEKRTLHCCEKSISIVFLFFYYRMVQFHQNYIFKVAVHLLYLCFYMTSGKWYSTIKNIFNCWSYSMTGRRQCQYVTLLKLQWYISKQLSTKPITIIWTSNYRKQFLSWSTVLLLLKYSSLIYM